MRSYEASIDDDISEGPGALIIELVSSADALTRPGQDGRMRIFHVATRSGWDAAQVSGAYTTSTYGVTLAQEGYIHASRADQWEYVRRRYYADVAEPLVLLEIESDLLDVPVVEEPPAPGIEVAYPHVYGPITPNAVVAVTDLR